MRTMLRPICVGEPPSGLIIRPIATGHGGFKCCGVQNLTEFELVVTRHLNTDGWFDDVCSNGDIARFCLLLDAFKVAP